MGKRKKSAVHEENIEEDEQNHAESSSSSNDKSLYEILGVETTASQHEIKKAYHKLALRLHPDKNPGDEDAKEKFQHLQKVISILGDEEKRAVYDQTGCVDDTDLAGDVVQNLKDYFRSMYKKVTEADIEEFESNYRGSESEKNDLIDLYKKYKGHMNMLFCSMLCSEPKLDSHRFKDILDEAISAGELKSTKAYQKWGKQVSETKPPVNPLQRRGKSNTKMDSSDSSYTSELISLFLQGKREVDALIQSMIDDEEVMSLFTRASSSNPQRRTYVKRDCVSANERLMQDYFNEHPTYDEKTFRRRFRMSKRLFLRIAGDLEGEYEYFQQREDARHQLGFTCIQKCTAAIRILAYGNTTDINDDYLNMAEKTSREALENFCNGIINMYKDRYLRSPTFHDLNRIYDVHQVEHSFPGMIGSIGCMHWEWSNCPTAWRGQYTCGDHGVPTVSLQAICSHDLWVWSAFFGSVGSNNDINVLNASPVLDQYISRSISVLPFYANDNEYEHGYYLGDEIYPEYSIIVKTFQDPIDERRSHFKKKQEFARKDVERLFRILKKRWSYVKNPCRVWALEKMSDAMYTCIILHNMILEDEGRATCQHYVPGSVPGQFPQQTRQQRIQNQCLLQSSDIHNQLKDDLVLDVWGSRNFQGDPEDEESTNN